MLTNPALNGARKFRDFRSDTIYAAFSKNLSPQSSRNQFISRSLFGYPYPPHHHQLNKRFKSAPILLDTKCHIVVG